MYDLIIIGGGPAGYTAAERAGHAGLNVLLFEKKSMGGVCLNEGCIPTKTLLYSAKILDNGIKGDKYGVYGSDFRIDFGKIMARKNKVVRKLVIGVETKMKSNHVEVMKGEASITGRSADGVDVVCNGERFSGKALLICTGSEAFVPPIEGLGEALEAEIAVTNREILGLKTQPESLVIVGGGVIGMEFACFFSTIGTKVTVIEMMPEILNGVDEEMAGQIREIYAKRGIEFHLNSKVMKIDGRNVSFEKGGELLCAEGEKILVSVGRKAVVSGFGLENIGVEFTSRGIVVDEKLATNVPGIFAAGDVTGFSLLAHTASREGEVVVNNLLGKNDVMSYRAIPAVVYSFPEIAAVGETEKSAADKGIAYRVVKLPMSYSGRFVAENEGVNGMFKILADDKTQQIIGVHIFGNPASEMIFGACIAIEKELTVDELKKVVFPHPTVSEILKESLFEF